MTLIRLGHSPDPDDAFMFYALAKDKIATGEYRFEHELVDIETLNRRAFSGELELTASVGVAATKLVAKVASDLDKPDGLVVVAPQGERFAVETRPGEVVEARDGRRLDLLHERRDVCLVLQREPDVGLDSEISLLKRE